MKRIIYIYCLLILISCDFSEKKVYKNLYITNGGENQDYNVAAIKLDENNQLNVFPFDPSGVLGFDKYPSRVYVPSFLNRYDNGKSPTQPSMTLSLNESICLNSDLSDK